MNVAGIHAGTVATVARAGVAVRLGQDVEPPAKTSSVNVAATVVVTTWLEVRLTVNGSVHKR